MVRLKKLFMLVLIALVVPPYLAVASSGPAGNSGAPVSLSADASILRESPRPVAPSETLWDSILKSDGNGNEDSSEISPTDTEEKLSSLYRTTNEQERDWAGSFISSIRGSSKVHSNLNHLYGEDGGGNARDKNYGIASKDVRSDTNLNLNQLYAGLTDNFEYGGYLSESYDRSEIELDLSYIHQGDFDGNLTDDSDKNKSPKPAVDESSIYTYYKSLAKNPKNQNRISTTDTASNIASNLRYIYERSAQNQSNSEPIMAVPQLKTDADTKPTSYLNRSQETNPYYRSLSNIEYLYQRSEPSKETSRVTKEIRPSVNANLNKINQYNLNPYRFPHLLDIPDVPKGASRPENKEESGKNYAVIVGINEYEDRMGLHTSVNDAEEVARVLKAYGYEIVILTDDSDVKPTKENILEEALASIKSKHDLGKVIFYFSGHGEIRGNDYYLVPMGSNGDPSTFISEGELERHIGDIKNLAVIIDACNSGKLEDTVGDGQIILTSSNEDEPSNERWPGTLSVFTYNLCNAIREEGQRSKEISLQRCFYKARVKTMQWSSRRLLSQTPTLVDKTGRVFNLN